MGRELLYTQRELSDRPRAIEELNKFFLNMKEWTKLKVGVIGHVVWAPPVCGPCLYRSSQLYEGRLRSQARREQVLVRLWEERARLGCVLIRLRKGI